MQQNDYPDAIGQGYNTSTTQHLFNRNIQASFSDSVSSPFAIPPRKTISMFPQGNKLFNDSPDFSRTSDDWKNTKEALEELASVALQDSERHIRPDGCTTCTTPSRQTPTFVSEEIRPDEEMHSVQALQRQNKIFEVIRNQSLQEQYVSQFQEIRNLQDKQIEYEGSNEFDSNTQRRGTNIQNISNWLPDVQNSNHYFAGPGLDSGPGRYFGWRQWWRTIGYYLDEFKTEVPKNEIAKNMDANLYTNDLPHSMPAYLLHKVGGRYGRAIARFPSPICGEKTKKYNCSSWLAGGPFLFTSKHCRKMCNENEAVFPVFGNFTFEDELVRTGKTNQNARNNYVENRLISLGLQRKILYPVGVGPNIGRRPRLLNSIARVESPTNGRRLTPSELTSRFKCTLSGTGDTSEFHHRDVDWYRCEPLDVFYDIGVNEDGVYKVVQEKVRLLPSHIWGSVPLITKNERRRSCALPFLNDCDPESIIRNGRHVFILQRNQPAVYGDLEQTLLSYNGRIEPKEIYQEKTFFSKDLYWEGGSSGGAVLDLFRNRALGVLSGSYASLVPNSFLRTEIVPQNYDSALEKYKKEVAGKPMRTCSGSLSSFIKGRVFKSFNSISCPQGMVAAGIIGSKGPLTKGRIGNFGLVCLPFSKDYLLDQAQVIATGSADTARGVYKPINNGVRTISGESLNTYINEVVTRRQATPNDFLPWISSSRLTVEHQPQVFTMCPPNYFLRSISVQFDPSQSPMLLSIPTIECANHSGQRTVTQVIPEGFSQLGGWSRWRKTKLFGCSGNCFINGLAFATDGQFPSALLPLCGRA